MRKEKENGFTFIEVMVALVIIAITVISVLGMQSQSVSLAGEARFYTTASLLAQGKMAEIEVKDLETFSSDSGDFGEEFPGYTWRVEVRDVYFDRPENVSDHLKQVNLAVSWGENEFYQYALRVYRFYPKTG